MISWAIARVKNSAKLNAIRRYFLRLFGRDPSLLEISHFKAEYWQSEAGARNFIRGSDGDQYAAAAMMDSVVNTFFLDHCPPHSKVMDIGCGHGVVSLLLARQGHKVVACDVSSALLATLAEKAEGLDIELRKGDAHAIPARDGEFDVVVARMFLGHFPDWPVVLAEMARCTRRGGRLLVHFTSRENLDVGRRHGRHACRFADSPDLSAREIDPFGFFAAADERELLNVCRTAGLKMQTRAPNTFFLHNRIIGHALGDERYHAYQDELQLRLKDDRVREFAVWFERTVVQHLPVWASYYNTVVFEKIS